MPTRINTRRLARIAGHVLVLLSAVLLGQTLWRHLGEFGAMEWQWTHVAWTAVCSLGYGLSFVPLAYSWSLMIVGRDDHYRLHRLVTAYAVTGILKYLPGNIFHFIGRNVVGSRMGVYHLDMGAATLFEVVFSLVSSAFLASLVLSINGEYLNTEHIYILVLFGVIAIGGVFIFIIWKSSNLDILLFGRRLSITLPRDVPLALILNLTTFAGFMIWAILVSGLIWEDAGHAAVAGAVFLVSWLVGFVVPGAPGGIGIREATIVLLLGPVVGEADALAFSFLMRVIAVLGDAVLFLFGKVWGGMYPMPRDNT